MKQLFFGFLIVILLSSCATHVGFMTGNAAISDANFNVVGMAVGTAKTQHIVGIGGLSKDALILEAKRNLYANYPLKKGQALANVTVDMKRSMFPFVFKTLATVSADVIDFNTVANDSLFSEVNKFICQPDKKSIYSNNEKVIYKKKEQFYTAYILDNGVKKSTILMENDQGIFKVRTVSNAKIFSFKEKNSYKYSLGEVIRFMHNETMMSGKIKAINDDVLVVNAYISKSDKKLMKVNVKDIIDKL